MLTFWLGIDSRYLGCLPLQWSYIGQPFMTFIVSNVWLTRRDNEVNKKGGNTFHDADWNQHVPEWMQSWSILNRLSNRLVAMIDDFALSRQGFLPMQYFTFHHCKQFDVIIVALSLFHSKIGPGLFFDSISFSAFMDIFKSSLSMFTLLWCSNLLDWNCLSDHRRLFWFT